MFIKYVNGNCEIDIGKNIIIIPIYYTKYFCESLADLHDIDDKTFLYMIQPGWEKLYPEQEDRSSQDEDTDD
jgi:hypothetical protein